MAAVSAFVRAPLASAGGWLGRLGARMLSSAVELNVPPMGDSISEGTIAALLKGKGESVGMDEVVAQIETDKVTIDVRAPDGGVISDIFVSVDDTVGVGQPLAVIATGEGAAAASPAAVTPAPAEAAAPVQAQATVRIPSIKFPPRRAADGAILSARVAPVRPPAAAGLADASPEADTWRNFTPAYDHIARAEISEEEMEAIMLGGAEP